MGHGWTHSYDVRLSRIETNSDTIILKLMDSTGRIRYFKKATHNHFAGMYHERTSITQAADG
jgi:hypothetical protein